MWKRDQKLFKHAIQTGQLVTQALFSPGKKISVEEGIEIYHKSHDIRLDGFLRKDFPVSAGLLGSRFAPLARQYRIEYPSRFSSGTDFGRSFPQFMRSQKWIGTEAAAPDLARLEWSLLEILYTKEVLPSGLERVASASSSDWEKAKLLFDSSFRILDSVYPIDKIYELEKWYEPESTRLVLWRSKAKTFYRRVDPQEAKLLIALAAGVALGALPEAVANFDSSLFSDWLETGLVKGIRWT